ncbi:DUF2844 domain-containing protein [Paraburkholderia gardini]|uniref:DUF2844 domain-containing protein n=1 Tax=Paraburkholderia gardini TaxID=2823469 RepID=A0ABN7QFP8_9BURK|nr:DUF2844 domain-containing protein [Paraburkholderia gardini]CAG4891637.1 hypothetical protein R54767_01165 [Paraburkholderia gardini]
MSKVIPFYAVWAAVLAGAMSAPGACRAELGRMAARPPAAGTAIVHSLKSGSFQVRTTTDDGGTTISEYTTPAGQVFAYTWQGPTMPDLKTLLGSFYDSWRDGAASAQARASTLHATRIAQPDVVVESGGQMRSYVGRAWLPGALPAGVSADDLR